MGHPAEPFDDEYTEGDECAACNNVIFHGRTPQFMKALFSGIVSCGEAPPTDIVPPIYLQQDPEFPCIWSGFAGEFDEWFAEYWAVIGAWSVLLLDGPGGNTFYSAINENCRTSFSNDFKCEENDNYEGGSGSVRWGLKVDEEMFEVW